MRDSEGEIDRQIEYGRESEGERKIVRETMGDRDSMREAEGGR